MNFLNRAPRWAVLPERLRGMFNLNDPRWGRGEDQKSGEGEQRPDSDRPAPPSPSQQPPRGSQNPQSGQPPDLDELWRDLNRKLSGLFGGKPPRGPQGRSGGQPPEMKGSGIGVGLIAGVAVLVWLSSGFFIVQEGQQAVITQFGKYHSTVGAGFNWRLPYPIQSDELVYVSQIRSVEVGRDNIIKGTGLRDSAMLTKDENIVEIKFAVQYRLKDARDWLFQSKNPDVAVVQAAESAVREVVGSMRMDAALADERDQIASRVRDLMQKILDRYQVGVEVIGVNLQQGGVRPPEQVQAAFDDVLKAGQERERAKNEAQAYANDVVPRARGTAARLKEEADAYRSRIAAQAEGDAQRFVQLLPAYQKAPQVMRDRMYTDAMKEVYSNVTKVLVDSRQGSNLLYLPLDKIMQQVQSTPKSAVPDANVDASGSSLQQPAAGAVGTSRVDHRAVDMSRSRDR